MWQRRNRQLGVKALGEAAAPWSTPNCHSQTPLSSACGVPLALWVCSSPPPHPGRVPQAALEKAEMQSGASLLPAPEAVRGAPSALCHTRSWEAVLSLP